MANSSRISSKDEEVDREVILATSSSVSELDVDAYHEKKKTQHDAEASGEAADPPPPELTESDISCSSLAIGGVQADSGNDTDAIDITYTESKSYDVDEMIVNHQMPPPSFSSANSQLPHPPKGAATTSSSASAKQYNTSNNNNNNNSAHGSNYSSSNSTAADEITTRTRLETLDSANMEIDFGYDIDHRNGKQVPPTPPRGSKKKGSSTTPRKAIDGGDHHELDPLDPTAPSECTQFAKRLQQYWGTATQKIRNAMLHVLVETSVKAAQYPMTTIVCIIIISFSCIVVGYMTNFNLRLDNERLFTPTSSEVVEHSAFMGDMKMYEPQNQKEEPSRRRQLQQARILRKMFEEQQQRTRTSRNLATTFDIFGNTDQESEREFDVTSTPPGSGSSSNNNKKTYSPTFAPTTPSLNANDTTPTTTTNTVSIGLDVGNFATEVPTNENTVKDTSGTDKEEQDMTDSNNNDNNLNKEEDKQEEEEEEEERYYQRGKGLPFPIIVHQDTENVFTIEGVQKLFDLIDFVRNIPEYADACRGDEWSFHNLAGENTCEIRSITRFWNHNRTLFEEQVKTNEDLFDAADQIFYPDGGYADLPFVLAEIEEDEHGRPVAGQAFIFFIMFKFDWAYGPMTDNLLRLQTQWEKDDSHDLILEFVAPDSFAREVQRAIIGDLPLIPTVFVVMCTFTMLVFLKCHKVYSRCLLGVGAVVTIMMSIMSGYGILFIAGVPMTVMTNLLVFVIFGIGLDDTFIITGAYFRTDHRDDPVKRVRNTMEAVGSSILLTTITTSVAFLLGCTSTIEPIRWLCLYAFPAIMIDFFYQITFFVAILVLDERRIQSNRMDCLVCVRVPDEEGGDTNDEEESVAEARGERSSSFPSAEKKKEEPEKDDSEPSDHIADRFMRWFASKLMREEVKIIVMLVFFVFAGVCAYSTSKLRQQFNFKDLLPRDSYASSYATAVELYSDRAIAVKVTFRLVDQADEDIRDQMMQYVTELVEGVDALNEMPPIFWVREFKTAVASDPSLQGLPFYDQVKKLLENPAVNDAIGQDIHFRDDGTILASQVKVYVTDLDMDNVKDQIEFFQQQREITMRQPVNQGEKLWAFFGYDLLFHIFAFYEVAAGELAVTTLSSVMAVCIIAFLLIPHWSAVPIILPLLSVLYIEMMGILQMFGYSINVVTYVILVVSIGLLVDFIMHILLRYYESEYTSREEKVKDALGTMGASILVGGLSTFLGVTPLIFSSSEIFSTVCLAFLAMVFLGVTHGLIVLPVILSYVGTESIIRHRKRLSLVKITAAISEAFHSMDISHNRHQSLVNCHSRSQESEQHV